MVTIAQASGVLKSQRLAPVTPNPTLHPTAKRRRRLVPVALRAPAAGEGRRYAATGVT